MSNLNLNLTKYGNVNTDEFYTQMCDIISELSNYKDQFKDMIVYCNCDDPEKSNFWKYFDNNFEVLQLSKLISTHIESNKPSYKLEILRDEGGGLPNR